ncbi:MAG: glycosyltransferase [Acidobacteriota bacterium]
MTQRSRSSPADAARVLLFSMRNLRNHVARGPGYEFEDVIRRCDSVDVIAPAPPAEAKSRIGRCLDRITTGNRSKIDGRIVVDQEYELFFAFCLNPQDLRYMSLIEGLRDKCRRLVCVVGELWPGMIGQARERLEVLRCFDCVFSNFQSSVEAIRDVTGRPCYFLPPAADALLFCPSPVSPARCIDVYNIGRRPAGLHDALMARAECGDFFYVYDTVGNFPVLDAREHRALLANLIKRSRYFVAYPAKFDKPGETNGLEEIGSRFFEGAAGGAVMVGASPRCAAYDQGFDWPDAVIPTAADGARVAALIAELESDPRRIARIRRDNVVNSLQRHDWAYRWHDVLNHVGIPTLSGLQEREARLKSMAAIVAAC